MFTRLEDKFSRLLELSRDEYGYKNSDEYDELWFEIDQILTILDSFKISDSKKLEKILKIFFMKG